MNSAFKTKDLFIKNEGFCIKNEESCIQNDGFCRLLGGPRRFQVKHDEFCLKYDEFCIINDEFCMNQLIRERPDGQREVFAAVATEVKTKTHATPQHNAINTDTRSIAAEILPPGDEDFVP